MNNYIRMLLLVLLFSGCTPLETQLHDSNFSLEEIDLNQKYLNKNYIGMAREQIIYMFGIPIISDSFDDVYHYQIYYKTKKNILQKKILSLYFKNDKVLTYDIK